ncbi:C45 family autoproteolytic acyltransferase/hydolase [Shouchella patagoniensis]|uniref:C45 family autoproteolytic acyltransferase/hydolase n=1 Tax=Shouchella patagoniensis TaxID=228576 RepID=UPI0009957761|nr:C45 family peptidase [Shouchella patagoniensis]
MSEHKYLELEDHLSFFQRGKKYGDHFRYEINGFLSDNLARINKVRKTPILYTDAMHYVKKCIPFIEREIPNIAEEILGLSRGAQIPYEEAMLLQLRRELISDDILDCTAFSNFLENGNSFLAENVDLPGNLSDLGCIVKTKQKNAPDILMYTHIGLLGYLGMNSSGLAIGINMVMSDGWGPGVPPYLIIKELLLKCHNTIDCINRIKSFSRTSSRNFMLVDNFNQFCVEMTPSDFEIVNNSMNVHTNHYLNYKMKKHESLEKKSNSVNRHNFVLSKLEHGVTKDNIIEILTDHEHDICLHSNSNANNSETIGSVIMYPSSQEMSVNFGKPCKKNFITFKL